MNPVRHHEHCLRSSSPPRLSADTQRCCNKGLATKGCCSPPTIPWHPRWAARGAITLPLAQIATSPKVFLPGVPVCLKYLFGDKQYSTHSQQCSQRCIPLAHATQRSRRECRQQVLLPRIVHLLGLCLLSKFGSKLLWERRKTPKHCQKISRK